MYEDQTSSFEELLKIDNSCTTHQRNIQALAIEMFKTKNNVGPAFMKDIFIEKDDQRYSLRNKEQF